MLSLPENYTKKTDSLMIQLFFLHHSSIQNINTEMQTTVLLWCNTDGSEKLTELVIVHSKKPQCFKKFLTSYKVNNKAWMFKLFLKIFCGKDREMQSQKRKIILFISQCSVHVDLQLKNV